ncbi:MAG: hypothetical protein IIW58_01615 [Bacteroidales bacterium]|nr:hypothetical protein [Bacteroidales bacterium]
MDELYLNISNPRKEFKNSMGHANHFLITALIGLDYLDNNKNVECPPSFSTSWNPRNKQASIYRTRQYILNSSLAWAVDCLDSYFSVCNQDPKLIDNIGFIKDLDKAGRSVNEKLISFSRHITTPIGEMANDFNIYKSIVGLAIQWRNNTIHSGGDNKLEQEHKDILLASTNRINELFCNLEINQTLNSFEEHKSPTFKEVTSIIRGIQRFVEIVDSYLISKIDIDKYASNVIACHCKQYNISQKAIISLPIDKRNSKIINILKSHSFSETAITNSSPKIKIDNIVNLWVKRLLLI